MTPLLDTLFLLLFAVLASSDGKAAREQAPEEIRVELPSVEEDEAASTSPMDVAPIVVTIGADGGVSLDDGATPVASPQELGRALARLDLRASVEIRAHADARHAVVVEVLHGLRAAGRFDVRFVATRRDPGESSADGWGRPGR